MKVYARIASLALLLLLPVNLTLAAEPASAPDFKLQDVYQDYVTLSSYKDKQPVILFFWATWDPFSKKELSVLNDMYAGFVKDGTELLAINSGELPDVVNNFIQSYNLAYLVLLDKDTSVTNAFGVQVPAYVLIDKEGNIVYKDNYFPSAQYKDLILKKNQ